MEVGGFSMSYGHKKDPHRQYASGLCDNGDFAGDYGDCDVNKKEGDLVVSLFFYSGMGF